MLRELIFAAGLAALPNAAGATDAVLGNWNIQTLTYPGDPVTVFPSDYQRGPDDYRDLIRWRDMVGSDVYFLQEVTSPAAIDAVFPASEGWTHCISGQYALAENLPAGPVCSHPGEIPHKPQGATRVQYTGIALRPGSPFALTATADVEALNVKSLDDGAVRDVRWGLDVTLTAGAATLRALVVHLKSGCFDDRIAPDLWLKDPAGTAPAKFACDTLGRQLFPLRLWVEAREAAGEAWLIVGDFNRRLDAGAGRAQDEVWKALSGYSADTSGADRDPRADIPLYRAPYKKASECWTMFRNPDPATLADADDYNVMPIEFFVYGTKAHERLLTSSERHIAWPDPVPTDQERLSDHCPSSIAARID